MVDSNVNRHSREFNHGWMAGNPELFTQSVIDFHRQFPIDDWHHHLDMASRFRVIISAVRREQPYDFNRDYLREVGMGR